MDPDDIGRLIGVVLGVIVIVLLVGLLAAGTVAAWQAVL